MRRLAVVLCLAATPLAAQEVDCATAMAQVELTFCAEQDWKAADQDLNAAYRAAMTMMKQVDADLAISDQGAAENLKVGQRAWITYRDAACAADGYLMHGGSAEPMVIYGCRARLTQARAADLWSLAETY
jgi:uncharacterized protein YecT (DUF1311 family)